MNYLTLAWLFKEKMMMTNLSRVWGWCCFTDSYFIPRGSSLFHCILLFLSFIQDEGLHLILISFYSRFCLVEIDKDIKWNFLLKGTSACGHSVQIVKEVWETSQDRSLPWIKSAHRMWRLLCQHVGTSQEKILWILMAFS